MTLPGDDTVKWLISRYAAFRAAAGDALEGAELVTPTSKHFPDRFEHDAESVARLLRRMVAYTPVADDTPLALSFFEPEDAEQGGGGCGSCGPTSCKTGGGATSTSSVEVFEDGYRIALSVADVTDPVVLTSTLARTLGAVLVVEAGLDDVEEPAVDAEVAACATGFGVLLAAGSHLYKKSCGGVSVKQTTALSLEESALLLALFCAVHDVKPSRARAHLEPSQREAFAEAVDLVDMNDALVRALREAPETLADGLFPVVRTRGFFARLFSKPVEPEFGALPKRSAPRSEDELRRLAEAKALVEEALAET